MRPRLMNSWNSEMVELFEKSYAFKSWADIRTLDAIARVDRSKYLAEFNFARQQLNHMLIVEDPFRSRLNREPKYHRATNTEDVPEFEALALRLRVSNERYRDFVQNRDLKNDDKRMAFEFTDGKFGSMTQEEMLFHIVNHASYHRGTIARSLDQAEVAHPADIFTMYLHQAEPDRRS